MEAAEHKLIGLRPFPGTAAAAAVAAVAAVAAAAAAVVAAAAVAAAAQVQAWSGLPQQELVWTDGTADAQGGQSSCCCRCQAAPWPVKRMHDRQWQQQQQ